MLRLEKQALVSRGRNYPDCIQYFNQIAWRKYLWLLDPLLRIQAGLNWNIVDIINFF
jgi:hypothetical protein